MIKELPFTKPIQEILSKNFGKPAEQIFTNSSLIQYINQKTKSVNKGSKSRSNFASIYAIFVLVEDYIKNGFDTKDGYSKDYKGAEFTNLFKRQRELKFGGRLQNHALNNRVNHEFKKIDGKATVIIHDVDTEAYWINEELLKVEIDGTTYNIAKSIIEIIDKYVEAKTASFELFVSNCQRLSELENSKHTQDEIVTFVMALIRPEVDARLFEIVSYSILKYHYHDKYIFWGYETSNLTKENLKLYKTGRTNSNDGGIDFVMKPLGVFFQVTETLDFKKYFLDIDKIQRYPITFVVKSELNKKDLLDKIRTNAQKAYSVSSIIDKYMNCIEDVINIPKLKDTFTTCIANNHTKNILDEILLQSKVEFNYEDPEADDDDDDSDMEE